MATKSSGAATTEDVKTAIKRQALVLLLDEQRAIEALPNLVPDADERRRDSAGARIVVGPRVLGLDKPARVRKAS